jgi:hypothetical protein
MVFVTTEDEEETPRDQFNAIIEEAREVGADVSSHELGEPPSSIDSLNDITEISDSAILLASSGEDGPAMTFMLSRTFYE